MDDDRDPSRQSSHVRCILFARLGGFLTPSPFPLSAYFQVHLAALALLVRCLRTDGPILLRLFTDQLLQRTLPRQLELLSRLDRLISVMAPPAHAAASAAAATAAAPWPLSSVEASLTAAIVSGSGSGGPGTEIDSSAAAATQVRALLWAALPGTRVLISNPGMLPPPSSLGAADASDHPSDLPPHLAAARPRVEMPRSVAHFLVNFLVATLVRARRELTFAAATSAAGATATPTAATSVAHFDTLQHAAAPLLVALLPWIGVRDPLAALGHVHDALDATLPGAEAAYAEAVRSKEAAREAFAAVQAQAQAGTAEQQQQAPPPVPDLPAPDQIMGEAALRWPAKRPEEEGPHLRGVTRRESPCCNSG